MASLPPAFGSADSLAIAQLALRGKAEGRPLVVLCARATDVQRLAAEIPVFAPALRVALFPDWETLPYDTLSPHQDLVSDRLATMALLSRRGADVIVTAATTALQRLAPVEYLAAHTFRFDRAQRLDEAQLRGQLTMAGYEHVTQVVKPGEFSVRGGLIDLFPMGSTLPYRLDLFGDEIESIRTFDPDTQRSLYPVERVDLLPGREFPLDEVARGAFRGRWRERFEGDPSRAIPYRDVGNGIASPGIEYWLPLFHAKTASLFDYLQADAVALTLGDVEDAARGFLADALERWRFLGRDAERPLLEPNEIFLSIEELFVGANRGGRFTLQHAADAADEGRSRFGHPLPALAVDRRAEDPVAALRGFLARADVRTLIVAESAGRRETLAQYLAEHGLALPMSEGWADFATASEAAQLAIAPIADGFLLLPQELADPGLADLGMSGAPSGATADAGAGGRRVAIVTEAELFAGVARRRSRGRREAPTNVDAIIRDLSELSIGDPVVHQQHGIGRYCGLVSMDLGDGATEFLELHYAGESKLFVPVSQLHLIGRYSGASPDEAPLHALGSGAWEKAKRKAAKQARDTAAELLNIYARRASREGHAFRFEPHAYESFASGFGFEETPDQLAAIHATVQDMVSGKPMDRLVCGDVGFGKTEVALRAAFVAVMDGKQVAVLAPTTLLAEQHFQTFTDRFSDFPVKIAEMSRFRSPKEVAAAVAGLADGTIDIVIGTHKLLSKDTHFKRLGLVIIDEEHRFGVRHKETLKAMRAEVDVLTLTATPIPRTLAMSMEGLRDFSVIATAPQRRLAIKTFVRREGDSVIREAMLRELKRGGQAYFLHNEVDTIENRRQMLEKLLPEARIVVAHGQMPERELERVMKDFHQQRFNVLLCTTIIETGIDVPTANTIVIHRADRFGLAQLHQLRGRVGRSHHQAYAYLMIPDEAAITKDATKRLEAIQQMEELGSGFFLAMHDLEIRGAGEVLGENQSGNVHEVGFQIYTDMIDQAVRALKAGREPDLSAPLAATTEINLHAPALLPADYCPDVHERLTLYKRLANCADIDALVGMQEELVDRFGKLPEAARALVETHRLRILGTPLGITKIDAAPNAIVVSFKPDAPVDPTKIIGYVQSVKDTRLAGPDRLRVTLDEADFPARVVRVKALLRGLGSDAKDARHWSDPDPTQATSSLGKGGGTKPTASVPSAASSASAGAGKPTLPRAGRTHHPHPLRSHK